MTQLHLPMAFFVMLAAVLLASALFVGYATAGSKRRSLIHVVGFVVLHVLVFAVIFDLEYPRAGLLREETFDQALVDLRQTMTDQ
jgi:hypothetical protein